MSRKVSRKTLPNPSVFKYKDRWVCEFYVFDSEGRAKARRKSFLKALKSEGKEGNLTEQRTAANSFRDQLVKDAKIDERLSRREREETRLSLKELKEVKAALAVFNEIPYRNKSLIDAVVQYRDRLKLPLDTPALKICVGLFIERKREAAENGRISYETHRTLKQRLNHMLNFTCEHTSPKIRLGEVTSKMLIQYFDSLGVSERTKRNYVNDVTNFFNDVSDPRDKNRYLEENPMDGVYIHYKKSNQSRGLKTDRKSRNAPVILQHAKIRHVMKVAFEMRHEGMLGFTVAGLFLGMRPSELYDLVKVEDYWQKHIKLDEGIVRIDGFGKKRDQRNILISETCSRWLHFIKANQLPLCFEKKKNGQNLQFANFRAKAYLSDKSAAEKLIRIRRLHKVSKKPNGKEKAFMEKSNAELQKHEDVLRHTFGTLFYYGCGFDKNRTIEQMGHSSEVFIEHYRGLLDNPDDWKLTAQLQPSDFQ